MTSKYKEKDPGRGWEAASHVVNILGFGTIPAYAGLANLEGLHDIPLSQRVDGSIFNPILIGVVGSVLASGALRFGAIKAREDVGVIKSNLLFDRMQDRTFGIIKGLIGAGFGLMAANYGSQHLTGDMEIYGGAAGFLALAAIADAFQASGKSRQLARS